MFCVAIPPANNAELQSSPSQFECVNKATNDPHNNQLKHIQLYCSYYKAGDIESCSYVEQLQCFEDREINLKGYKMLQEDMECVAEFVNSSSIKAWVEINLSYCNICAHIDIMYRKLNACECNDVTIEVLQLNYNHITGVHASWVSEIVVNCKVHKLFIDGNHGIGESEQLYFMLSSPSTNLEVLYMNDVRLSYKDAIYLFKALQHNKTLKELIVTNNNITDRACEAITTALKKNNCLAKLWIWNNPLSSEASKFMLGALKNNCSLERLGLPCYNENTERNIISLKEVVNKTREDHRCQVKLSIDFM